MKGSGLLRWSGVALLVGGVVTVLFALLAYPTGGATAVSTYHPLWVPAHTLHIVSAILGLFGLIGVYGRLASTTRWVGFIGFGLSFAGMALFGATGALQAFVYPILAKLDPASLDRGGAFHGATPILGLYFITGALQTTGLVLLALAILRSRLFPRLPALLLIPSAVAATIPPPPFGPMPWPGLVAAGMALGTTTAWLGYVVWKAPESV